ncbi:hypothetical protein V1477_018147 [Vespula maculifrons]|uniref:Uncharacterized protein n=1 Tax=Vespula maculifrons TaxID=7453 RepID=A0ABD2AYM4_VESMC
MREKKVVRPFISSLEKRKVGTPCRGIVEQDKVNTIRTRQIGPKRYVSAKEDAGGNESRKEHESRREEANISRAGTLVINRTRHNITAGVSDVGATGYYTLFAFGDTETLENGARYEAKATSFVPAGYLVRNRSERGRPKTNKEFRTKEEERSRDKVDGVKSVGLALNKQRWKMDGV